MIEIQISGAKIVELCSLSTLFFCLLCRKMNSIPHVFISRRFFCTQKRRKLLDVKDQRVFLEEIASKFLGINKLEDWYSVKASDLEPHGGEFSLFV